MSLDGSRNGSAARTDEPDAQARENGAGTNGTERLQLKIGGMSCSFCVSSIEKALSRVEGVHSASVNLAHEEALIEYEPDKAEPEMLKEIIRDIGYTVRDPDKVRTFEEEEAELRESRNHVLVAAGFSVVALFLMALMRLGVLQEGGPLLTGALVVMPALALVTVFGVGRHILGMAWGSLKRRILNQHVLLEFGAFAGLVGGALGYFFPSFPVGEFFAVSVFITTYHLLSEYTSLRVRTRSSQAVRKLLELVPNTARVVRDGVEEEVAVEEIGVGELVRVRPGESIPVDGEVVEGSSGVDQSLVTGESIPEQKGEGDEVIGGSIAQGGTLLVRVTKVGEESFLSQVARQVEEARALKPGILQLVDRVLQVFVPTVVGFAGLAILIWTLGAWLITGEPDFVRAIFAALAVLVMGYPCALGMATPLALIRGGGMAARRGILMRSGEAFQVLKEVDKVVLDKTGTITEGEPSVAEVVPLNGYAEDEALRLAAAAESFSEHPLGRAVVAAAKERELSLPEATDFQAASGKGVSATVEGRRLTVGSPRFIEGEGIELAAAQGQIDSLQEAGNTVVAVAAKGDPAALIAIADRIKAEATEVVESLKAAGLEPVMVTGDNGRTARAVASQVDIAEYRAEVLPEDKAAVVQGLQQQGHRVIMVGDGINDAPALMQSDVGLAIGAGTDIAIESADVVLVGERLGAVVDTYHIGQNSYRKTVQNITLAFAFNGVGVPLAVTGLVSPIWAMVAMAASVTTVLANSFGGNILSGARRADDGGKQEARGGQVQLQLTVPNMRCGHCLESIREAVTEMDGVEDVSGDPEEHRVTITYNEGDVEPDGIREAMIERGFQPEGAGPTAEKIGKERV